jgi:hypothetical protein
VTASVAVMDGASVAIEKSIADRMVGLVRNVIVGGVILAGAIRLTAKGVIRTSKMMMRMRKKLPNNFIHMPKTAQTHHIFI